MANNEKPKSNNTMIHDTICLFLITLIAGVLLGGVYTITKKPIADQNQKTKEAAYQAVYSGASFAENAELNKKLEAYSAEMSAGKVTKGDEVLSDVVITEVLTAQVDGADAGYVMTCQAKGYGGMVTLALGITLDGTIQGIQVTDCSSETPGLGQNSSSTDFNGQYVGMNSSQEICVVKDGSGSTEGASINAISGATITSKAVTRSVNGALSFIASLAE